MLQEVEVLKEVLEPVQKARGVRLQNRTYKANLGWHRCRRLHDCVVWAFHLQINHPVELLGLRLLRLTLQILLHCCFAVYWQPGLTGPEERARREVSCLGLAVHHP